MRRVRFFVVLSLLALGGACSSLSEVTPEVRREMQNFVFERASYESVFQSIDTVLRDDGYAIKIRDPVGGLIVASVEKTDKASAFFAPFKEKGDARKGEGYEISINLERVNAFTVKARTTIQRIEHYALLAQEGEEVLEPLVYRGFYDMVRVEIGRRAPAGGGLGKPPPGGFPVKLKPTSG